MLLATSQLKDPRQRSSPRLLLAMRVKELRLKAHLDCWGWGRGGGRAQETVPHPPPPRETVAEVDCKVSCGVMDATGARTREELKGGDSGRRSTSRKVLSAAAQGRLQGASCSAWLLALPQCLSLWDPFVSIEQASVIRASTPLSSWDHTAQGSV